MSENVFTDNDLKRLKEDLSTLPYWIGDKRRHMEALLARLEAETNAADLLQLHYESGVFDDLDEGDVALVVQALEARLKAAGR